MKLTEAKELDTKEHEILKKEIYLPAGKNHIVVGFLGKHFTVSRESCRNESEICNPPFFNIG